MTIETALKWSRLWWLLSLDLTVDFQVELWLDKLSHGSFDYIRSSIDVTADLPTYGSDPRPKSPKIYSRLNGYTERFGREGLDHLSWWESCVFIHGGSDRASEFLWKVAAYSQVGSVAHYTIATALESVREDCLRHDRRNDEKARNVRLSKWDQQAIAAEQSSREEVLESVKIIASTNAFVRSWNSNVTVRGIGFLGELFAVMSGIPASAELQFDPETIPFPSSWEFDLRLKG